MGMLDGRVCIVTGAAQGIGAAYARGMAAEGARVVVADVLDPAPVVDGIRSAGGEALGTRTDVTDDASLAAMVKSATDGFGGRIDALVNNAALFGRLKRSRFEDIAESEFDAVMRVNIRGVWQASRAVVPVMRRQKYGKIVNIASGTVFKGTPMQLHYVTSKGAVIAMSRAMAREVGDDNICVNTIAPGLTMSENVVGEKQFSDEHFGANIGSRCIRRAEQPDDLVGAAVFLCSAESDFVTGQVLVVDGGSAMN
jgi:NAD(P)-dependent dehydrogenase (short-subunit alcohol dehydrogenase family)